MKTNAIVRIVIYALVILLLLAILCAGLGLGTFYISLGSENYITGEGSVAASEVSRLELDWAAGSIRIVTADTDQITFTESGYAEENQRMVYSQNGGTLKISYSKTTVAIGFVSIPSKDLTITVPEDWVCQELELDGASLEVEISGLTVTKLDIDGASNTIRFTGSVNTLECDGAACEMAITCTDRPRTIDMDGAACQLELTLPKDCGFRVEMDGLSCDFRSDLAYTIANDCQIYGDEYCRINADGISCEITIHSAE